MTEELFISEIKQFNVYFTLIMAQIKKNEIEDDPDAEFGEEYKKADETINQFNDIYLSILQDSNQSIVPFLDMVFQIVIVNDTIPTSLLRVTIKTLTRIFDLVDPNVHLKDDGGDNYCPSQLINSLVNL